jgi:hypothetical protein
MPNQGVSLSSGPKKEEKRNPKKKRVKPHKNSLVNAQTVVKAKRAKAEVKSVLAGTKAQQAEQLLGQIGDLFGELGVNFMLGEETMWAAYYWGRLPVASRSLSFLLFEEDFRENLVEVMGRLGCRLSRVYSKEGTGQWIALMRRPLVINIIVVYRRGNYWYNGSYQERGCRLKGEMRQYPPFEQIAIELNGRPYFFPDLSHLEHRYGRDWRRVSPNLPERVPLDDPNQDSEWQQQVTIGIKTFLRPECLENCLRSIRLFYPLVHVIVADDSPDVVKKINRAIATQFKVDYLEMPFDSGLSVGRNAIVRRTETPYFVCVDDDTVLRGSTDLKRLYLFLRETDYDLIGGASFTRELRHKFAAHFLNFSEDGSELYYRQETYGEIPNSVLRAYKTDRTLNYFMAKRDALRRNPWDERLKLREHTLFFVRAWEKHFRIAVTPEVVFDEKRFDSPEYTCYRQRGQSIDWEVLLPFKLVEGEPRFPPDPLLCGKVNFAVVSP